MAGVPKHRDVLVQEFGLGDGSKAAVSPGVKDKGEEGMSEKLEGSEASSFRSVAARAKLFGDGGGVFNSR